MESLFVIFQTYVTNDGYVINPERVLVKFLNRISMDMSLFWQMGPGRSVGFVFACELQMTNGVL